MDSFAALTALDWQIELGADEAIADTPINRYEQAVKPAAGPIPKTGPTSNIKPIDIMPLIPKVEEAAEDIARILAGRCTDLETLRNSLATFDLCSLKKGARNLVFADGNPAARVMIIGDAPTREEDQNGKSFVGRTGQLLDKMFAAIDMDRAGTENGPENAIYLTNVMPWRPPQDRDPTPEEIAMMLPFLERHIALANPDILVPMGNIACKAILGKTGITRIRGHWTEAFGKPTLPMFHPAGVLRDPLKKRDCWTDLLALKARLNS
ncbi:MAG: uracil-DNA glycosylase [Amylibacter sp.]